MMSPTFFKKIPPLNLRLDSLLTRVLILLTCLILFVVFYLFLVRPFELKLETKINRYPTQLSHLGQLSKTIQQNPRDSAFIPFLNEQEFEVLRAQFKSLGMQPNIFRLINSNEPKIEIQMNEVDFSTWLHLLDDLRMKYHLYTETSTIQKGTDLGTVQVSVTLVQKR